MHPYSKKTIPYYVNVNITYDIRKCQSKCADALFFEIRYVDNVSQAIYLAFTKLDNTARNQIYVINSDQQMRPTAFVHTFCRLRGY